MTDPYVSLISPTYRVASAIGILLFQLYLKGHAPPPKQRKIIECSSYKNFDEETFSEAVGVIPFQAAYVFDDVDDIYWAHEVIFTDILNEHAPVKEKYVKTKVCPFINY